MNLLNLSRAQQLFLQTLLCCGLGCLLIGTAAGFPFAYSRTSSFMGARAVHQYQVEHFEGQVSNVTPAIYGTYDGWLDAIEIREFYTNGSPVILHLHDFHALNITYVNFYNLTAEPINLNFTIEELVVIEVRWNSTPAFFSCWLFLRQLFIPPVISVALDMTPTIVSGSFVIFGIVLILVGFHRWGRFMQLQREEQW